ncbi:MAG: PIG-L deacetylase family protein [Bryobacteraceae bacterium]
MRFLVVGAHPDDCEYRFAGTTIKLAAQGHAVKYLSVTNGDAGHHVDGGASLVARRKKEAEEGARRAGAVACETLDNQDGEYEPTLANRREIIRQIREWKADVVLTHRPYDYHPDHRYTAMLVQDSAFMVTVPNICPVTPALRQNPIFLYLEDNSQKPMPFRPDIVVDITDTWEKKVETMDAHTSQFYEWLPWLEDKLDEVPPDPIERKKWLSLYLQRVLVNDFHEMVESRYGKERASEAKFVEGFEVCEYGRQPSPEELDRIFPR